LFAREEMPLEIAECRFSSAPEVLLIWHGHSVATEFRSNPVYSVHTMECLSRNWTRNRDD
jgi:hypothetical protein